MAIIIAVGINSDGRREVLGEACKRLRAAKPCGVAGGGMDIGLSKAETVWTPFLRKLARRGLIATALAQDDAAFARQQGCVVADQLRPKVPKLAALMDESEGDVLAYMTFPPQHCVKLNSTNPLERLNGEIKRRTGVVGILPPRATSPCFAGRGSWPAPPNEATITRRVGAILLKQNDE